MAANKMFCEIDCFQDIVRDGFFRYFFERRKNRKARPAQLAELPRSEFDPELFPHSAYVKFFVTFVTKVPYLIFSDKMRQFLI